MLRVTPEVDIQGSHQGTQEVINTTEAVEGKETESTIESTMNGMSGSLKVQAEGKDLKTK